MRIAACLLDLDGTLVDSAPDLAATTDRVLAAHGRPPIGLDAVRAMVGDGARALVTRGFAATGGLPSQDVLDAAVRQFLADYEGRLAELTRPFPGVAETLHAMRAEGVRLAVCTNKLERFSIALLDALGLTGLFDAVIGGDTFKVRKPDGGHLTGALARLDLADQPAVMVGDSRNDVLAARNAGLPVVVVTFGYTAIAPAELGADALIDRFADLPAAIANLPHARPA